MENYYPNFESFMHDIPWDSGQWVIFAGSAISCMLPSGLPLADHFKEAVLKHLTQVILDLKNKPEELVSKKLISIYAHNLLHNEAGKLDQIHFETFLQLAYDAVYDFKPDWVPHLIVSVYDTPESNRNHKVIAEYLDHLQDGKLKAVVTTNFDRLIEQTRMGTIASIVTKEDYQRYKNRTIKGPAVFHLHGDIDHPEELVYLMRQVGRIVTDWRAEVLKNLLVNNSIIVGYSASDPDIAPVLRNALKEARSAGNQCFWVNKKPPPDQWPVTHVKVDLFEPDGYIQSDELASKIGVITKALGELDLASQLTWLASLYRWCDMPSPALTLLRQSLKLRWSERSAFLVAECIANHHLYAWAGRLFKELAEISQDLRTQVECYIDWAYCERALGKLSKALRIYDLADKLVSSSRRQTNLIYASLATRSRLMKIETSILQTFRVHPSRRQEELKRLLSHINNLRDSMKVSDPLILAELDLYEGEVLAILRDPDSIRKLEHARAAFVRWGNPGAVVAALRLAMSQRIAGKRKEAIRTWWTYVVLPARDSIIALAVSLSTMPIFLGIVPPDLYWHLRARAGVIYRLYGRIKEVVIRRKYPELYSFQTFC